ncbi:MAG: signal recognition particle protein [Campylobacterota bacterium]|nr:signal recognition particle protein [Campylobacterota bacterium]
MFSNLSDRINNTIRKVRGRGRLTAQELGGVLREIKLSLLEADVHYKVTKSFVNKIREKAIGKEIEKSLSPGEVISSIVYEEMVHILGEKNEALNFSGNPPFVIMVVGLQGSGKTTTTAKLARFLRTKGRNPILVSCDPYRPAAKQQLSIMAKRVNAAVFENDGSSAVDTAKACLKFAKQAGKDVIILDTAGRLHIEEDLMQELEEIKKITFPKEILFVADAMMGQEAVNIASEFNKRLNLSGVIFTKIDGDARGGAVLSIKSVTGSPIKFIGTGEKVEDIELFHPDRTASRILGMGDMLTLVEKVKQAETKDTDIIKKLKTRQFTLDDFLEQIRKVKKMGSLAGTLKLIPGLSKIKLGNMEEMDKETKCIEAVILSMTKEERKNFRIINASRKRRIAKGSGTRVPDVNRLLKQFNELSHMMKGLNKRKAMQMMQNIGSYPKMF